MSLVSQFDRSLERRRAGRDFLARCVESIRVNHSADCRGRMRASATGADRAVALYDADIRAMTVDLDLCRHRIRIWRGIIGGRAPCRIEFLPIAHVLILRIRRRRCGKVIEPNIPVQCAFRRGIRSIEGKLRISSHGRELHLLGGDAIDR